MNRFIATCNTYPLTSTSAYTVLQPMGEGSIPLSPTHKSSSSWRKFIHASTQQPRFISAVTVIPAVRTTTEGPTVLKLTAIPEDYDTRKEAFRRFLDSLESEVGATADIATE